MKVDLSALPVNAIREQLLESFQANGKAVVTAPPGSGKSTLIPLWVAQLLPPGEQVIILQPRRLAARMLAERVAWQLGEKCGQQVGYITRFEQSQSAATKILFVTEGVLLRMLVESSGIKRCGAIIFDEFHQRSLNGDLSLALAIHRRNKIAHQLKLLVMSATLDAAAVAQYLGDAPVLSAQGRMYPVEIRHTPRTGRPALLDNTAKALREAIEWGAGDVLIFMPGVGEIRRCVEDLSRRSWPEPLALLPLYGDLPPQQQRQVMTPDEQGRRKVIIATNVAETSLTIPGVRIVIDSGLVKLSRRDAARGADLLETLPICNDSAEQRAGRAGREAPGLCIRLWSALEQDHKPPQTPSEISRGDLAAAILAVHSAGFQCLDDFPWFEAPPPRNAQAAQTLLQELGLITPQGAVTTQGRAIQSIPAHPRTALLLWRAAQCGCYDLACGCAALLGGRALMDGKTPPRNAGNKSPKECPQSDFLAQLTLLHHAAKCNFAPAECAALGVNLTAAREIARDEKYYLALPVGKKSAPAPNPQLALSQVLLECFPDRLARRIAPNSWECELQQRRRATIATNSTLRNEQFFICAELRAAGITGRPGEQLEVSLLSGVKEEWLWELFGDDLQEEDTPVWDPAKQQVLRRRTLSCRGLILEESLRNDPPPDVAAAMLAEMLESNSMPLTAWDERCDAWINRVEFVAKHFPELEMPVFDEERRRAVRLAICQGENRYQAVRAKEVLPFLQEQLTPKQLSALNRLAPESLPLPRGRKLRIEYRPGMPPKGRARIQELYDLKHRVTVADGRVPVLLDILAPNYRTVQITDDLPRFWEVHYPSIRSQLARRYPKHEWR